MHLNHLELSSFRNLKDQRVEFPSRITVIVGKNGQGKTSLLEAAYILSHAKSFRTSRPRELVNWDKSATDCQIEGTIESEAGSKSLSYKVSGGKKEVLVNKDRISSPKDYYGLLRSVEFTPDDLSLVSGAPAGRRQFFDRVISQVKPSYVDNLVQYHRALKQRNALLLQGETARNQFEVWDSLLVRHGLEVSRVRGEVIEDFKDLFSQAYNFFTGYEENKIANELVTISYSSGFWGAGEVSSEEELVKKFTENFPRDIRTKSSTFGIHRDDYALDFDSGSGFRIAKSSTSQGQKRSIALALKFASIKLIQNFCDGESPILLLDDVESELDRFRKQALFWKIVDIPAQVIITATEISNESIKALDTPSVVEISEGQIRAK